MTGSIIKSVLRMGVVLILVNQFLISTGVAAAVAAVSPAASVQNSLNQLDAIVDRRADINGDTKFSLLRIKMEARSPLKYLHAVEKYVIDDGSYRTSLWSLEAGFNPPTDYMYRIRDFASFRNEIKSRVRAVRSSLINATWRRENPGCLRAIMGSGEPRHSNTAHPESRRHNNSHREHSPYSSPTDRSSNTYYICNYHRSTEVYDSYCPDCEQHRRELQFADNKMVSEATEGVSHDVREDAIRTKQEATNTVGRNIEGASRYVAPRADENTHLFGEEVQDTLHSDGKKAERETRKAENTSSSVVGQTERGANHASKQVEHGISSASQSVREGLSIPERRDVERNAEHEGRKVENTSSRVAEEAKHRAQKTAKEVDHGMNSVSHEGHKAAHEIKNAGHHAEKEFHHADKAMERMGHHEGGHKHGKR